MKISTFDDDLLELEGFAERLESFITTESEYVEGSLVLSLTSKYGSGKTTFLEMWKSSLDSRDEPVDKPLVVSLNAWESDYYGDPLFAIITALVECLESKGKSANSLVNAAKGFGWFATAIGSQIVNKVTGIDAVAAGELAERKKGEHDEATENLPDTFSVYQDRKAAMESLKREIGSLVAASEPRIFFFVDELDRCRPDYAITYLETIKHIFDIKGAMFLLAADREQLENSARSAFGPDLDFEEYYRKFIQREITLPQISEAGYKRLASKYVTYYLERERHCFLKLDIHRVKNISQLISALELTPRQIQEVFRILGHIFSTTKAQKGGLFWGVGAGSILMAALKVGNARIFHLLGTQKLECEEAISYLKRLLEFNDVEWWFLLLVTGDGIQRKNEETDEELMQRGGLDVKESISEDLGQYRQGWGNSGTGRFKSIHEKIEQILQWK